MEATKTRRNEFTVRGSYPFPLDMLRRDECFPATEQDAAKIADTYDEPSLVVEVRLAQYVPLGRRDTVTTRRWESRCWKVLP